MNTQIIEKLSSVRSATFVGVVAHTTPEMLAKSADGTPNPFREGVGKSAIVKVRKRTHFSGMVAYDYAGNVNRQREREGQEADFEASAPKWGERVSPALVAHNGKMYADIRVLHYVADDATPYFDVETGKPIPVEMVRPFLPQKREKGGNQGLEKTIEVKRISLDNIRELRINKEVILG